MKQHLFRTIDFFERIAKRFLAHASGGAFAQNAMIPGAEHETDAALGRHVAPIAPGAGTQAFFFGGLIVGERLDIMIVEPVVELVQHLALAGAVGAVDERQHAFAFLFGEFELRIEKTFTKPLLERLEILLAKIMRQSDGLEHSRLRMERP